MPCAKVSFVCSLMLFITILAILLRQVVTHQTKRKECMQVRIVLTCEGFLLLVARATACSTRERHQVPRPNMTPMNHKQYPLLSPAEGFSLLVARATASPLKLQDTFMRVACSCAALHAGSHLSHLLRGSRCWWRVPLPAPPGTCAAAAPACSCWGACRGTWGVGRGGWRVRQVSKVQQVQMMQQVQMVRQVA
jgi:hypothetical protein